MLLAKGSLCEFCYSEIEVAINKIYIFLAFQTAKGTNESYDDH